MRALVGGVGAGCGYLVAGFFAWEVGALVKRRGFYAVPGRWVLTWGQLIRVGPWRRGLPRVFRAQRVAQVLPLCKGIR